MQAGQQAAHAIGRVNLAKSDKLKKLWCDKDAKDLHLLKEMRPDLTVTV